MTGMTLRRYLTVGLALSAAAIAIDIIHHIVINGGVFEGWRL